MAASPAEMIDLTEMSGEALLDRVFAALADPVRRAVLTRLDGADLLVSELAAPFDISLQAVSRHIQVLVRAGLVKQERTGRISRCRFDAKPIHDAAIWLNRYSKYWQAQFDLLAVSLEEIEREKSAKTICWRMSCGLPKFTKRKFWHRLLPNRKRQRPTKWKFGRGHSA